ncbi:gluconate:H+ symporter [Bacillus sp. 1P06AnD]|uniref:GntT/GntP/DsdX family permease n=1 Tax=Bacillus sp. 1P06AnD TaxID=3132208 RepID=UPI0039A1217D
MSVSYLLILTLLSIGVIIVGVSVFKWHPFISLLVASLFLGICTGLDVNKLIASYEAGVGDVLGNLAGIIGLGTILGKMLSDSGGGYQIANSLTNKFGVKNIHWAMLFSGFIIGIPVFFEVGLVILLPLVIAISKGSGRSILFIGLPVLAGLSIVHGLVPPHPGAMIAVTAYHADTGKLLLYSLVIALPTAMIAGPIYGKWIDKRLKPKGKPTIFVGETAYEKVPTFGISLFTVILPVLIMILSVASTALPIGDKMESLLSFLGNPLIALLISVFVAFFTLGYHQGMTKEKINRLSEECLMPLATILLIMGAGGGYKQILIDSGVGRAIADLSGNLHLSPIVLAFFVAAFIRVATGSATVALTTAAGIVSPIVEQMTGVNKELLVIATGAGSLIFSHVNDSGFWMVKEYFGLTVKETFKSWTVMETLLSLIAFGLALLFDFIM